MRRFLKILMVAVLSAGAVLSVCADTDENGLTPKHWYKFDGNLNSSGETALTISGENGASYVASADGQAYLFKSGYHPYGSGMNRGSGDFTVVTVAKTADLDHGIIWTQGSKTTSRGFGLVTVGATKVALRTFSSDGAWDTKDIVTITVPNAATRYRVYTLVYTDANKTFTLYLDDLTTPVGSGTVKDSASSSAFPNTEFQWGSLNGGLNYDMTQGYGVSLDDYRLYQQALTVAQIGNIVRTFAQPTLWGNAGTATAKGIATTINGGAYTSFTVDFGDFATGYRWRGYGLH